MLTDVSEENACFILISFSLVYFYTLNMEAICSSKTSGSLRTTLSYSPEDRTLPSHLSGVSEDI
jgi:hypothetical protein